MSLPHRAQVILLNQIVWPFLLLVFFPIYLMRFRKKSTKAIISLHKRDGGRVVLFSATKDSFLARKMIRAWLLIWRVPYDRLVLRPKNEGIKEFKHRILQEEECDILLENEPLIVYYLINHIVADGIITVIDIVHQGGYFTIHFERPPVFLG